MIDKKILVLGFSVTAERPGFVGLAKDTLEQRHNAEVVKVGLGGLQPYHARYLFPQIIADHDPDILILDHATPAFRNFYNDQADYRNSLLSILRECYERRIRVAVIDFPRTDVDYDTDWVSKCHERISSALKIPYLRIPVTEGVLRDEVHTTEFGSRFYADALLRIVPLAVEPDVEPAYFEGVPRYGSVKIADILPDEATTTIDRGGYATDMITIPARKTLTIPFASPQHIGGFTTLMGPRTGTLELQFSTVTRRQMAYDQFCYYERMGAFVMPEDVRALPASSLKITQTADVPAVVLLKGEKNTDTRVGAIGHIFTEVRPSQKKGCKMKVLVFGFSVTGEVHGYVEKCVEMCKETRPEYEIQKIGIGGLQPDHARHLVDAFLREHKPDALIIEFSTAAYRTQSSSDYRIQEQHATLHSILRMCKEHSVRCGILDLPLTGVNPKDDWVADVNATVCKKHHIPHKSRDLQPELLWDNVHPNNDGKQAYATTLLELLDEVKSSRPVYRGLAKARKFSAYTVQDAAVEGGYFREFSRHGYVTQMLAIPEGEGVAVTLPKTVALTALIVGMGPKTGLMVFQLSTENQALQCYDPHCYYERVGGRSFKKTTVDKFVVRQSAMLPTTKLLKGTKDTGPRIGGITHILYEE